MKSDREKINLIIKEQIKVLSDLKKEYEQILQINRTEKKMNFITALWKKIPTKTKVYGAIIIAIILAFIYYNWKISSLEAKLTIAQGNVAALKDTVRVVKTKNGELETVRLALLTDKKGLKQLSDSLYKEYEKEKGKPRAIIKVPVYIKGDTVVVESQVIDSSILWAYDREDSGGSRHIAGISNKKTTTITRDEISLNLIAGIKEREDKKMEIFVRSKYPGVVFGNIEGAIIDPTTPIVKPPPKHFSIGPGIGVMVDPTGSVRYGVGISLQWALFKF